MKRHQLKHTQHILRQQICMAFLPEDVLQQRMYEIIMQPGRLQMLCEAHQQCRMLPETMQMLEDMRDAPHSVDWSRYLQTAETSLEFNQQLNVRLRTRFREIFRTDEPMASEHLLSEDPVLCYDRYIFMDYQDYDVEDMKVILPWCMIQMLKTHPLGLTWNDFDSYILCILDSSGAYGSAWYRASVDFLHLLCTTYRQRRTVYQWLCFMHRLRLMREHDEQMKEVLKFWRIPRDWNSPR